jgi:hypothetical protein
MKRSCRVRWSTAILSSINARGVDWRLIWILLPGFHSETCCRTKTIYFQLFAMLTQFYSEKHHSGKMYRGKMSGFLEILFLYYITPLSSFVEDPSTPPGPKKTYHLHSERRPSKDIYFTPAELTDESDDLLFSEPARTNPFVFCFSAREAVPASADLQQRL